LQELRKPAIFLFLPAGRLKKDDEIFDPFNTQGDANYDTFRLPEYKTQSKPL